MSTTEATDDTHFIVIFATALIVRVARIRGPHVPQKSSQVVLQRCVSPGECTGAAPEEEENAARARECPLLHRHRHRIWLPR